MWPSPYKVDKKGRASATWSCSRKAIASAGVVSTVRDLGCFDAALDSGALLRNEDTLAAGVDQCARSRPGRRSDRARLLFQRYNGQTVVWQFGQTTNGYSSLILKIPARRLTLILLANSDGLSSYFDLASGDVTKSLFGVLFLRLFA